MYFVRLSIKIQAQMKIIIKTLFDYNDSWQPICNEKFLVAVLINHHALMVVFKNIDKCADAPANEKKNVK